MHKLVISDDEGKQTVVPLVRDEITIGRKEGNTIRLTERNVSRRHARLVKASGKFVVEDLHSYNGVRVNGQRIGAETSLEPGDQIAIGDYTLALQLDGADQTIPVASAPGITDADTAMIAAPGPPARLVMVTPPAPGAEFALTSDRIRIGRAEDLDVWINHRSISREHAEIQKEPDGQLRLIDLGSANGVRVNNKDVQNAVLHPGDVVELGQVRFRFVAAGELYAFDADATVQMDAVTVDGEGGGSRTPIFVGIAIVLLGVIGAIAVAVIGGGDDGDSIATHPIEDIATNAQGPSPYERGLSECNDGLTAADATRALDGAREALLARPGDPDATRCEESAQALSRDFEVFQRGRSAASAGDGATAVREFQQLPPNSAYRAGPNGDLVRTTVRTYATAEINRAQRALAVDHDPNTARQLAQHVLSVFDISPEQTRDAQAILASAEAQGAGTVVAVADDPVVEDPSPPSSNRGGPRGRRVTPPDNGGGRRRSDEGNPTNQGNSTVVASNDPPASGPSLEEQARECTQRGDNSCVIRLLEGHARSQVSLGLLIEAYRAQGRTNAAIGHIRTYVDRWGNTPTGRNYQQLLSRQSQ
ncbi:MAG: FHA domain-containing protein [Sandaracinaceae bacterium]